MTEERLFFSFLTIILIGCVLIILIEAGIFR